MIDQLMTRKQRREFAAYLIKKHRPELPREEDEEIIGQPLTFKIQHQAALLISILEATMDEIAADDNAVSYLLAGEALGRAHILQDLASTLDMG